MLPVRRKADFAFSIEMENAQRLADCSLRAKVDNFEFVSLSLGSRIDAVHGRVTSLRYALSCWCPRCTCCSRRRRDNCGEFPQGPVVETAASGSCPLVLLSPPSRCGRRGKNTCLLMML